MKVRLTTAAAECACLFADRLQEFNSCAGQLTVVYIFSAEPCFLAGRTYDRAYSTKLCLSSLSVCLFVAYVLRLNGSS